MNQFYETVLLNSTYLTWNGDDALTFLAGALVIIMFFSLAVTHVLTTQSEKSKGKAWIPTSTNIKPNMNKF